MPLNQGAIHFNLCLVKERFHWAQGICSGQVICGTTATFREDAECFLRNASIGLAR